MPKAVKRTVAEHKLTKSHTGHSQHLCDLVAHRKMDRVAELAKDAKYVCHICGRAAAKAANLCEPVEI
jgi:DNA-binding MurR/RpiR family transcriptional regulator